MVNFYEDLKNVLVDLKDFNANNNVFLEEDRRDVIPFDQGVKSRVFKFLTKSSQKIVDVESDFNKFYFLDSVQRTFLLGFCKTHPIFYHLSAASILKRVDKILSVYAKPVFKREFISSDPNLVKKDFVLLEDMGEGFSNVLNKSNSLRKILEYDLLVKISKIVTDRELVFFDGPLPVFDELETKNVMGVIKRNFMNYLGSVEELLNLNVGEMSRIFLIKKKEFGKEMVFLSFYVKLFDGFFDDGIIRVELPFSSCSTKKSALIFACIIFKERFPFSSSNNQVLKKMYPISVVEKYLSSQLPKIDLIKQSISVFS